MNEAAFAGVRDGRVEWIAPTTRGFGHTIAFGLCEDDEDRPSRSRRGCTEYGVFSP